MKIFVTVGTQLPFDRMVKTVDEWAFGRDVDVFAQVGPAEYQPKNIRHQDFVDPPTFDREYGEADFVVAHAGMGSIFSALRMRKPLIIMPRLARFREHRNDHQKATAHHLRGISGIHVAEDARELTELLEKLDQLEGPQGEYTPHAQPQLLERLSDFINETPRPRRRDRLWRMVRGVR